MPLWFNRADCSAVKVTRSYSPLLLHPSTPTSNCRIRTRTSPWNPDAFGGLKEQMIINPIIARLLLFAQRYLAGWLQLSAAKMGSWLLVDFPRLSKCMGSYMASKWHMRL